MPRGVTFAQAARIQKRAINPSRPLSETRVADNRNGAFRFSAASTLITISGLVVGRLYQVTFDYYTQSGLRLRVNSPNDMTVVDVNNRKQGQFVGLIYALATTATIQADGANFTGSIANVQCVEIELMPSMLVMDPKFATNDYWAVGYNCYLWSPKSDFIYPPSGAIYAVNANKLCMQRTNMLTGTLYNFSFDVNCFNANGAKIRLSNDVADGTNIKYTSAALTAGTQTLSGSFTTSGTNFQWIVLGADTAGVTAAISNFWLAPATASYDLNFKDGSGNAYVVPQPRVATHEYLGTPLGIRIEEALTQGVANPHFDNANALPTNWQLLPTYSQAATITFTRLDTGVATLRFQGSATGQVYLQMGAGTQLTVASGDVLCGSWKWRHVAGSLTGIVNLGMYIQENDVAGALSNFSPIDFVSPVNVMPTIERGYHQGVITVGAAPVRANLGMMFGVAGAFDFTLEISDVQLEKRPWRSSWSAVNRTLDNPRLTGGAEAAHLANASRTVIIEAQAPRYNQNATLYCEWKDASNYIELQRRSMQLYIKIVSGGSTLVDNVMAVLPTCSRFKVALSLAASQVFCSVNGKTAASAAITIPTAMTQARIGWGVLGNWNGAICALKTDNTAYNAANTAAASAITTDIFDDFDRANGALNGSVAPTGQTWTVTGPDFATATIVSKKFTQTGSGAAQRVDYAIANLGRDPVYGGASFIWNTGNAGGAAGMIGAENSSFLTGDALHQVASDASATWGTITGGTVDAVDATFTYQIAGATAPMARDNSSHYSMAWFRNGNSVWWIGPYGESVLVTDSDYATKVGQYMVFEHYNAAAGGCLPQFTAVSAR